MSKVAFSFIGGPNDGQVALIEPFDMTKEGAVRYVPIRVGCLLPGQSVATERKHVYRYQHGKGWVYQGVE